MISVFAALNTFACDCDCEEISIEEGLTKSEKVFLGTVVSVRNEALNKLGREYFITEFKVKEAFKDAQVNKVITVISESTSCGGNFQKGQTYLIYTFKNGDFKMTEYHQCFKLALVEDKAFERIHRLRTIDKN